MSERSYLEEISIRNLGIIDQSELELGRGLNVLTGETGAGKTMILTALSLVLGGKSDSALVRHGSDRLVASATFSVPKSLNSDLEEVGAVIEEGSLIITRTVNGDGKSKAICGGTTVPAATLSNLADSLIEIHGQSANHQIVKPARQRELLGICTHKCGLATLQDDSLFDAVAQGDFTRGAEDNARSRHVEVSKNNPTRQLRAIKNEIINRGFKLDQTLGELSWLNKFDLGGFEDQDSLEFGHVDVLGG